MTDDTPSLAAVIESDDPELADQYNEAKEREIAESLEHLNQQEQEAVDALRESAQASQDTATVALDSGVELEVLDRIPPSVEQLAEEMQEARQTGDIARARRYACAMLAEMVQAPEEYTNAEVWATASRDGSAGMQWLAEVEQIVTEPAQESAEALQGNQTSPEDSNTTPEPMKGKESGWLRQG